MGAAGQKLVEAEKPLNEQHRLQWAQCGDRLGHRRRDHTAGHRYSLAVTIVGGCCGGAVAERSLALAGRTEIPGGRITFTTIAAYGSFWLAEYWTCPGCWPPSPPGIMMGNLGHWRPHLAERTREAVVSFLDYAAFAVVNSLDIPVMGMLRATRTSPRWLTADRPIAIVLVTAGRALSHLSSCCELSWVSA